MRVLRWLFGGALLSFSLFAVSIHFGKVEVNLNLGGAPLKLPWSSGSERDGRHVEGPPGSKSSIDRSTDTKGKKWEQITGQYDRFTVAMPGVPTYEVQTRDGRTRHRWEVDVRDELKYFTVYSSMTIGPHASPKQRLEATLRGYATLMDKQQWDSTDWVMHGGLLAADAIGVQKGFARRHYAVVKGDLQIDVWTYPVSVDS